MARRKININSKDKATSIAALERAILLFGSQGKLAAKLGIKRQAITAFLSGRANVPLERAIQIENISQGKIKKSHLRPDVF